MNVHTLIGKCARVLCACLPFVLPASGYAQNAFNDIYVLGDSMSDAGNVYLATGETSSAPYALVPSRPYKVGGHHFTNGQTWAERLAQNLQDNSGGNASLKNPGKNGNYAFGGARARSGSGNPSPDAVIQAFLYLGDFGSASAEALYVLQFGGNDIRDALVALQLGQNPFVILDDAAQSVAAAVQTLYASGARNFLVANSPNLAHAPAIVFSGASGVAGFLTGYFNGVLEGELQSLEGAIGDVKIMRLDLGGFTDTVVANPADFGLTEVNVPCLIFMSEDEAKCEDPENHLFWDGIHPTAAGHNAIAEFATAAVNDS